uniref:Receptor Binding Protein n=1 Tax=Siphoviridae sp. ctHEr2 TaxID=2826229 RepID=A0A8S5NG33_9CAUD|nr:MAG TPA: Receptor Binding Protein [Siphoviridae sp. ctHEr2]
MGRMFDGIISDGIFANYMGAFRVSPHVGLSVKIAPGRCWFNHRWFECDETIYLGLAGAHATYTRIDAVCVEVNESPEVRSVRLRVITGAPSSAPSTPEGIHTDVLNQYIIATVRVPPNATTIDATMVMDNRGGSQCPWVVAPSASIDTGEVLGDIRAKWESWFSTVKDAALNPPDANVKLAAIESDIKTIKRDWDISKMRPGTPDASSMVPFINRQFETETAAMSQLGFIAFAQQPAIHNQIFRGSNLGDRITNAQQQSIKSGRFDDLWLGDYWVRNNVRYTIAGFNYWLGQPGIQNNHIVVLARDLFDSVQFNTGDMTSVPNTYMVATTLNQVAYNRFGDVFGTDKIMSRPHNYATQFDSKGPSQVSTQNVKVSLMQPGMISTSGVGAIIRDTYTINYFNDTMILPLFLAKPDWRNTTSNHWLNYVYGTKYAAVISTIGAISAVEVTSRAACYPIAAVMG